MRHLSPLILFLLLLTSCGEGGSVFTLKGKMQNMNQAEFYIYSYGNGTSTFDTISVNRGAFTYTTSVEQPTTMILVFPNMSELPIIAQRGKTAKLEADASHLREAKVGGSKENKELSDLRISLLGQPLADQRKQVAEYITQHPTSPVSTYLFVRYYIQEKAGNTNDAHRLISMIQKAQPENTQVKSLAEHFASTAPSAVGKKVPTFNVTCVDGKSFSNKRFEGKKGIICTWASWNYQSTHVISEVRRIHNEKRSQVEVLSINLDATKKTAETKYLPDSLQVPTYCDGLLFQGELISQLGITSVPELIYIEQGKIKQRNLSIDDLRKLIDK